MSVINKMLRDLDQRHAGQPNGTGTAMPGGHATLGTLPVKALQQQSHHAKRQRTAWVAALLVAVLAGGWWYQQLGQRSAAPLVQTAAVQIAPQIAPQLPTRKADAPLATVPANAGLINTPAAVVSVPVFVPGRMAIATPKASKPVVVAPQVAAKVVDAKSVAAPTTSVPKPLPRVEAPVAVVGPDTATGTLHMESSLTRLPSSQKVTPQADVISQAVVARPAALDVLAQAQSLWNAGSHTAAIELLSQALSRVESSMASGAPVAGQSALASLARELARMQLADGQVGQALALLKRLEPQLVQVADVWAMRGNAAQRLGQHAEAAQSYQKALVLRPDEARWMLGAAVSLAAHGQTAAAGELADKARVMGALRPDVASYLRQLGVVIRSD